MKTCLVVDDSKVVRMVARKIVSELGFDVEEAADGQQALDLCQAALPDVVLLDWNMPVMDGLTFFKALKELPGGSDVRVVFCTTENDIEHIQTALDLGADEYIMKPFDSEIIESKFGLAGLLD